MIDRRLLRDTAVVELVAGLDDWGAKIAGERYTLRHVLLDRSVKYSGDRNAKNDRVKIRSGILFVYPEVTPAVIDDGWLGARVTVDGLTYIVQAIVSNTRQLNGKVFSYELEVI